LAAFAGLYNITNGVVLAVSLTRLREAKIEIENIIIFVASASAWRAQKTN
jgi:hypothetical protein